METTGGVEFYLGKPRFALGGQTEGFVPMKAYRILVHDRREDGPVVLDAELGRDTRAMEVARQRLVASPFVSAVELWQGETLLCFLTRAQLQAA